VALTDDQTAFFHRKLGTGTDMADIEVRLARLDGAEYAVVVEVLEERLATLVSSPASFTVPGEYSQDTRDNIKATQQALRDAQTEAEVGEDVDDALVYVQEPYYAIPDSRVCDSEEMFARGYSRYGRGR
jgi:hypothetical protein